MKAENNIRPEAVEVEICAGGIAEVILRENITEEERDGEAVYKYDEYRVAVPYRENLLEVVQNSAGAWLQIAKTAERANLAAQLRARRGAELAKCDWTQTADSPLSPGKKAAWVAYRQALRDIPEQPGFPYSVEFPKPPEGE